MPKYDTVLCFGGVGVSSESELSHEPIEPQTLIWEVKPTTLNHFISQKLLYKYITAFTSKQHCLQMPRHQMRLLLSPAEEGWGLTPERMLFFGDADRFLSRFLPQPPSTLTHFHKGKKKKHT